MRSDCAIEQSGRQSADGSLAEVQLDGQHDATLCDGGIFLAHYLGY
jgi:hypothetical protein